MATTSSEIQSAITVPSRLVDHTAAGISVIYQAIRSLCSVAAALRANLKLNALLQTIAHGAIRPQRLCSVGCLVHVYAMKPLLQVCFHKVRGMPQVRCGHHAANQARVEPSLYHLAAGCVRVHSQIAGAQDPRVRTCMLGG